MHKHSIVRHPMGVVAAAASVLCLAAGGSAEATTSKPVVAVFAQHYVVAGRVIDDLNVLENAVRAMHPQAVRLEACGAGTTRSLMAVAHRLRHTYLDLRVVDAAAPACRSQIVARAVPASHRLGERPLGIDDEAVERWWGELMP